MLRQKRFAIGVMALVMGVGVTAAGAEETTPTFSEHVAPILYENCVTCHRAGEAAPMSLVTYAETRPWSRSIRNKVMSGDMPPWHARPDVGAFSNARGLTDTEKETIARWVDAGAPEGDRAKLPAAPRFADGWQIGTPDVVLELPEAFEVPAEGTVDYQYIRVASNFTEDKWVRALELRAGVRPVVHHIVLYMLEQGEPGAAPARGFKQLPPAGADERFSRTSGNGGQRGQGGSRVIATLAPGSNPVVFEPGTAMRIPKGATLLFNVHYTAVGTAMKDQSKVGLFFADGPPEREVRADAFLNVSFELAAGGANERVDSLIEFTEDVEIHALFPHTHLRGKAWEYEITYPDGRTEPLLSVPNYDFNWQTYYAFQEPVKVPKGTRVSASAWYDNSAANKSNPDATVPVRWGEQTWEEMQYTGITYTVPHTQEN